VCEFNVCARKGGVVSGLVLGGGEEAQHEMCVTWLTATRMSLVFVSIYVWMAVSLWLRVCMSLYVCVLYLCVSMLLFFSLF